MRYLVLLFAFCLWLFPSTSEACSKYGKVVQDTRGVAISGASISVYVAGTTNLVSLYSDVDCTVSTSNPLTSDTDGTFEFYANDARVDITTVKTGYTFPTFSDVNVYAPLGDNVITIGHFSSVDICATGGAIDSIAGPAVLLINKAATCGTTKTIPSTVSVQFTGNGAVTVSSGVTLTVNGPVIAPHGRTVWSGTGTLVWGSGAGPLPYGWDGPVNPTYDSSVDIDNRLGTTFIITVSDTNNFTIEAPAANYYGRITITVKNSSGGAVGTITWNAIYKKGTFTNAANGFRRSISFYYDGTNWVEDMKGVNDVPN